MNLRGLSAYDGRLLAFSCCLLNTVLDFILCKKLPDFASGEGFICFCPFRHIRYNLNFHWINGIIHHCRFFHIVKLAIIRHVIVIDDQLVDTCILRRNIGYFIPSSLICRTPAVKLIFLVFILNLRIEQIVSRTVTVPPETEFLQQCGQLCAAILRFQGDIILIFAFCTINGLTVILFCCQFADRLGAFLLSQ